MLATRARSWLSGGSKRTGELRSPPLRFDPHDFEPAIRTRLLILQPTPFCNLDCDYCYLPDRSNRVRMPRPVVRAAAQRLLDDELLGDELTVVWHAGEPLVLPPAWYEQAFAEIAAAIGSRTRVTHSMQTNATLIDARWCDLFKRHAVNVGVSVDGPAFIHDRHRRTRTGGATHAQVRRGIETLRNHGIRHHAIAVVTAESLPHADEIVAFFEEQDIHEVGFNFDEAEGDNRVSSLAEHEDAHRRFLERVLERMHASGGAWHARELVHAFQLIAQDAPSYQWRGESWPENAQTIPFALLSVASNGDFCTFSPELLGQPSEEFGNFVLGNVTTASYLDAAQGDTFKRLWTAIRKGDEACRRDCAYFNYCGGGAPANKLYENSALDTSETLYCRAMVQRPFDVVLRSIERRSGKPPSRASRHA